MQKLRQPSRWLVLLTMTTVLVLCAGCGPTANRGATERPSTLETVMRSVLPTPESAEAPSLAAPESQASRTTSEEVVPSPESSPVPETSAAAAAEDLPGLDASGLPGQAEGGEVYYPREKGTYPEALVERARQNLAQRASTSLDSVQVVSVEAVNWPDASLGGLRGGGAIQVLTPGFRIVLNVDGTDYAYHTGLTDDPEDVLFYGVVGGSAP